VIAVDLGGGRRLWRQEAGSMISRQTRRERPSRAVNESRFAWNNTDEYGIPRVRSWVIWIARFWTASRLSDCAIAVCSRYGEILNNTILVLVSTDLSKIIAVFFNFFQTRSDLLKSFLKSILVPNAVVPLCSMVLTTTSKPTFFSYHCFYIILSYYWLLCMITCLCM